ncbi:hypothetical protein OPV22_020926 [Ensete ventricosum]|uniref:Uncharacterized protein n=1 Tax=Ensete ventricosum TaxID=4639 RepID=A0AAV8QBN7_ENSVE|nr:hypothetical protein OPV22_020926 [Ensete ventricosum]
MIPCLWKAEGKRRRKRTALTLCGILLESSSPMDKSLVKYDFSNLLPGHQNISPNDIILVGRGESCILCESCGTSVVGRLLDLKRGGTSSGNHVCTSFLPLPRWGQAGDLTDHQRLEQTPKARSSTAPED